MRLPQTRGAILALVSFLTLPFSATARAQDVEWDGFDTEQTAAGSTLLVPQEYSEAPRPLVILLPFTGGSAVDFLQRWYADSMREQAAGRGFLVLAPAARGTAADYATGTRWSETLDRFQGEVEADIAEAVMEYNVDPERVILAGYSMGGDLAWALPQRAPERYAGIVVMGSRASLREPAGLQRLSERGVRYFYFMGESESRARRNGASSAMQALADAGIEYRYQTAPGAHVWAPPEVLSGAIDYVLGYDRGEGDARQTAAGGMH